MPPPQPFLPNINTCRPVSSLEDGGDVSGWALNRIHKLMEKWALNRDTLNGWRGGLQIAF